jgi:hypothetical protein
MPKLLNKEGSNKGKKRGLEERLAHHPQLRAKIEAILDIVENEDGEYDKADDVEEQLIGELRKMGKDVFQGWAQNQKERKEKEATSNFPVVLS